MSPLLTFNLKVGFTFSVLSPLACFQCADKLLFAPKHAKAKALKKSKRGILEPLETAYCG